MSDDIRQDYEMKTGESLPGSSNGQRGWFSSLRTTWILLALLVALFGVQQAVSNWLIMVQPGQIVICETRTGDISPVREPGFHFCIGEATAFFEQRRVGGDITYLFKDGVPGSVNIDLVYSLADRDFYEWDPAVMIYMMYHTQEKFEQEALQRAILLATLNAFSKISSSSFLIAPDKAAPLIHNAIDYGIRGDLGSKDIWIIIDHLGMQGRSRIPIPLRPRFRDEGPKIPIQYTPRRKYHI